MDEWYLQYQISHDRPGLLGDIASLLGMLSINIMNVSGVAEGTRGFLIQTDDTEKISLLRALLKRVENITISALRKSTLVDRLAIKHGRLISQEPENQIYRFTRDELGILVDFLGETLKKSGHQVIGVRGMPRVGKTESIVAASVYAGRRWTFISSTLLRQTVRQSLSFDELNTDNMVYIIDGLVSTREPKEQHMRLIREIMAMEAPKIIEHPDAFMTQSEYSMNDFTQVIELRNHPDEVIEYMNSVFNWE